MTRLRMTPALKAALAKSKEFFGMEPRRVKRVRLNYPKSLVQIGACARVDYVSDKWDGKLRLYFHDFGDGSDSSLPLLFAAPEPQPNGDNVLIIVGRFTIEQDGIIG